MKINKSPKAKIIISIDTELAWGSIYDEEILRKKYNTFKITKTAINQILKLFEKYNISATWAIVGHLMLSECSKNDGIKHPDIIRPDYSWFKKDWFYYDPCTKGGENSIWYGNDILNQIINCRIRQEIGSHSFSHIMFGDKGCSKASAESDIKKCIEIAALYNIKLSSFIFPFNSEGHKDLLLKYGFSIYRGKGIEKYKSFKNIKIRRLLLILDRIFAIKPTTSNLIKDENGLLNIRGDFCYFRDRGWRNYFTRKSAVKKAKKGIDLAIARGEIFHFWFHPFEIAENLNESIHDLEVILEYANKKIKQGMIENLTMNQLSEDNIN